MTHIVKYRSSDGKEEQHYTEDIHDAVSFVEQLRNDQGVDGAQIYRLEQVNFDYRPYYRVELKGGEPMLASAPLAKPAVAAAPAPAARAEKPAAPESMVREVKAPKDEPDLVSVPTSSPAAGSSEPTDASDPATVGARRGLFGR